MKFVKQLQYSLIPTIAILGSLMIEGTIKFWTYAIIFVVIALVFFALKRFTKRPADIETSSDNK